MNNTKHTHTHSASSTLAPPLVLTSLSTSRSGSWNRWSFRQRFASDSFPRYPSTYSFLFTFHSSYPTSSFSTPTLAPTLFQIRSTNELYLGKSAHLVLCQTAAGASWCGSGLPSIPLHTRPNLQVMHPLPKHTSLGKEHCSLLFYFHITFWWEITTNNNARWDSPIFAEESDSGAPNRNSSAGPIDVPNCESNLGALWKVWILDRQPQPLVPAAQDSRRV